MAVPWFVHESREAFEWDSLQANRLLIRTCEIVLWIVEFSTMLMTMMALFCLFLLFYLIFRCCLVSGWSSKLVGNNVCIEWGRADFVWRLHSIGRFELDVENIVCLQRWGWKTKGMFYCLAFRIWNGATTISIGCHEQQLFHSLSICVCICVLCLCNFHPGESEEKRRLNYDWAGCARQCKSLLLLLLLLPLIHNIGIGRHTSGSRHRRRRRWRRIHGIHRIGIFRHRAERLECLGFIVS